MVSGPTKPRCDSFSVRFVPGTCLPCYRNGRQSPFIIIWANTCVQVALTYDKLYISTMACINCVRIQTIFGRADTKVVNTSHRHWAIIGCWVVVSLITVTEATNVNIWRIGYLLIWPRLNICSVLAKSFCGADLLSSADDFVATRAVTSLIAAKIR